MNIKCLKLHMWKETWVGEEEEEGVKHTISPSIAFSG